MPTGLVPTVILVSTESALSGREEVRRIRLAIASDAFFIRDYSMDLDSGAGQRRSSFGANRFRGELRELREDPGNILELRFHFCVLKKCSARWALHFSDSEREFYLPATKMTPLFSE